MDVSIDLPCRTCANESYVTFPRTVSTSHMASVFPFCSLFQYLLPEYTMSPQSLGTWSQISRVVGESTACLGWLFSTLDPATFSYASQSQWCQWSMRGSS
jgi:hypothetical protein